MIHVGRFSITIAWHFSKQIGVCFRFNTSMVMLNISTSRKSSPLAKLICLKHINEFKYLIQVIAFWLHLNDMLNSFGYKQPMPCVAWIVALKSLSTHQVSFGTWVWHCIFIKSWIDYQIMMNIYIQNFLIWCTCKELWDFFLAFRLCVSLSL